MTREQTMDEALTARAIATLVRLATGQKGGRSDYGGIVSGDEAAAILARLSHQDAEIARLREALGDVLNPIGYLQRLCERDGKVLSWPGAVAFASNSNALQDIARAALSPIPEDGKR